MDNQKSLISIIMSTYNDANFIKAAINSILNQTYQNWELIIIDDNSTDDTRNIVNKYFSHNRSIKYFRNKCHKGLISNLNTGINRSKGSFIARLDSDDIWLDRSKLAKQVNFLRNNSEYVLIGTSGLKVDLKGNLLSKIRYPLNNRGIKNYLLIENCFIHSSVLIRRSALLKVGYYDVSFPSAEDYGLWVKLGTVGKLRNLPELMTGYRVNPSGISYTKYKEQLKSSIKIVNSYKSHYPFYLIGYFLWKLRSIIPRNFRENISRSFRFLFLSNRYE